MMMIRRDRVCIRVGIGIGIGIGVSIGNSIGTIDMNSSSRIRGGGGGISIEC